MSLTLEIVRGADVWNLTDYIDWSVSRIAGFGLPPMHRLKTRGPMQHGQTDKGFRLDSNITTLAINMLAESLADQYTLRASLIEAFKPSDTPLILRVTLPDGSVRCRECHYVRGLDYDSVAFEGWQGRPVVQLESDEPTWYDPAGEALTFALGAGGSAGIVPFLVPFYWGASALDATQTIDYDGTWTTYPVIRVTGPIRDATIENLSTDELLDFSGTTIGSGEYYEIDLRYGYKTVEDSAGGNQVADLTTDSDLATWHLAADPESPDGLNSVNVTGNGVNAATKVEMQWYERFIGV